MENGELWVEEVPVEELAERYGTPLYVYSARTVEEHYDRLVEAWKGLNPMILYAVKANSNRAILELLAARGSGFDLVSGGELFRVLRAGGDPQKCTFAGVGKTRREIQEALEAGVLALIVESEQELLRIEEVAGRLGCRAPVALRINPEVAPGTHPKIATAVKESKFGIPYSAALAVYERAASSPRLQIKGVQMHLGSQITRMEPFEEALDRMVPLVSELKRRYGISFFDLGGGFGVVYEEALASGKREWWEEQATPPATPRMLAERLEGKLASLDVRIFLEPGRLLVGNAGILVTEVQYVKELEGGKEIVIVDAGMNDLMRPALYGAFHEVVPLRDRGAGYKLLDVAGPICESGDFFARNRWLPALRQGDRIAIMTAGAYGFSMACQYNSRPRAAEVMVRGREVRVVRLRETYQDLVRGERGWQKEDARLDGGLAD
ncbi:diaminopimelate decarboxylase [Candidatus Methylacidithermus pantelleriae]|nr:diaminopimelate decarboxylase [Candidatus Methylacidithermus pantelleriae]